MYSSIRNIAIIAHVDHGKTTLTDAIMRQTGMFEEGASMDSDAIEQERGVTIYAKNTATFYKDTKINIVDTPGHADFGSEVERVLRAIDTVLLIVDAQEGPMPQTRFVLKKSLELGLKPIVVINKIDKPAADVEKTHDGVLELFMELGANDEQLDFTTVYAIGREGVAMKNVGDEKVNLDPLLDTILEKVPAASGDAAAAGKAQVFNLGYDKFVGRLAAIRVYDGSFKVGGTYTIKTPTGEARTGKITKIFTFKGTSRVEAEDVRAGDIAMIAGFPDVTIGETLLSDASGEPMHAIDVEEPTIELEFMVNDSPFAGREGKFVTGRQIGERLDRELEVNVGLRVDTSSGAPFKVAGRGEMHISVLLENMRREGFELAVSNPQIIVKIEDGKKFEPYEEVVVDTPTEFQGPIMERLGNRKALLQNMIAHENTVRLIFEMPTRGLLGYRSQFIIDTKGEGILASRFIGFKEYAGEIVKRATGSMTSMATGKALGFGLWGLQDRGQLYIGANVEVYEGMVIGNTSKGEEMVVNPTKGKQLTNIRASGSDDAITLVPPRLITIESGLEIMNDDELLEVTPTSTRLRKKILNESMRARAGSNANKGK